MNKTLLIIQREFLSRVRKKSFIIMTLVGPILMASLFIAPILIAESTQELKTVRVLDETGLFTGELRDSEDLTYDYVKPLESDDLTQRQQFLEDTKYEFSNSEDYALLYIPCGASCDLNYIEKSVQIFTQKTVSIGVKSKIQRQLEKHLERLKLERQGVDYAQIEGAKTSVNISNISLSGDQEKESFSELSTVVGMISGVLIYFFIFLYGSQVMRGVIEEKMSKVVEVIVSSVRPFQLMLGKIVGVALVGLTQFLLWVVLTGIIVTVASNVFLGDLDPGQLSQMDAEMMEQAQINEGALEFFSMINSINFPLILGSFLFFFIGGYLLYSALFAAIGSAVDNESDSQQFMLPVTVPLILSFVVGQTILENPDSALAFWFSIIPLTSPIVMMIRVAIGVPAWELILSMVLLIGGFLFTVWLAGRIYRVGILMHGKKVSWGELAKWVKFKS
jgi:ABC-2 type transport system permease protein